MKRPAHCAASLAVSLFVLAGKNIVETTAFALSNGYPAGPQFPQRKERENNNQNFLLRAQKEDSDVSSSVSKARPGSLLAATLESGRVPYGEQSRKYRRTVFKYTDWVEHRESSGKILENLKLMLFSGVVRQLWPQVTLVTQVATAVLVWNSVCIPAVSNYLDLQIHLPLLALPAIPFTLSSPALGLLLVFRTNAAYGRWMEARSTWARMIAHGRNLSRMGSVFCDDPVSVGKLGRASWLYCRTVMNSISSAEDESEYIDEIGKVYRDDVCSEEDCRAVDKIIASPDRTMAAWKYLSYKLHGLPVADPKSLIETDKSIIILGECTATCEKTFSSPVPLVYTRHTARFLSLWTLLLPLAMYSIFVNPANTDMPAFVQGIPMVLASSSVALFLFGIDQLAMQLEEPFSILPMQQFCDQILRASKGLTLDMAEEMENP